MYRTLDTKIWSDPQFRALPVEGKLVFVYLITNPHAHVSGIYYLPETAGPFETGLTEKGYRKGIDRVSSAGLARFDPKRNIVWVVNMLRYQGCGDKTARSSAKQLESLHNSFLIKEFLEKYPAVRRHVSDRVSIGYPELDAEGPPVTVPVTVPVLAPVPVLSEQEEDSEDNKELQGESGSATNTKRGFVPPTVQQVRAYCLERGNHVDPEQFVDHYTANGWVQGRQGKPLKDWQAAVRTWEKNDYGTKRTNESRTSSDPRGTASVVRDYLERLDDERK